MPMAVRTEADWQEIELLGHRSDLAAWQEVVDLSSGPILELGCGVGRIARDLSTRSRTYIGLDNDPTMVRRFNETTPDPTHHAVLLDAGFASDLRNVEGSISSGFGLILAPMLFLQAVGGESTRVRVLSSVATLLHDDGVFAMSVNFELPRTGGAAVSGDGSRHMVDGQPRVDPVTVRALSEGVEVVKARANGQTGKEPEVATDFLHRVTRQELHRELAGAALSVFTHLSVHGDGANQGSTILLARTSEP